MGRGGGARGRAILIKFWMQTFPTWHPVAQHPPLAHIRLMPESVADPGGGWREWSPPLELVLILKIYAECAWQGPITPPPLECPRRGRGGGVLVNVQEWGCFAFQQLFGGLMTSRGRPRGVCACECLHPPPPLSGNPVSAPAKHY